MACFPLRVGSDAVGNCSVAPGVLLPKHHKMKQIFSRSPLWHLSRRGPSYVRHGRNMGSQALALEEMEANEINDNKYHRWQEYETKVLIAAKNQHDLRKLGIAETAGIELKNFRNSWKEIEAICKQSGVQRSALQCKSRWRRLILTYLQLKSWDESKTSDLSSFWSMKRDERMAFMKLDEGMASSLLLGSMDQATYSLLDEFYKSRADTVKDSLVEDAGEEVIEFRSVENLLPGEGLHLSSKEKSEVGGVSNVDVLCEKQVERVVVGIGEAHEGRLTSTEVIAFNEQLCVQDVATTSSAPVVDKCGSIDVIVPNKENMEAGDTISGFVEVTHEKQSGQVAEMEATVEETYQSESTSTDDEQRGQVAEMPAFMEETHQSGNTFTHFPSTVWKDYHERQTKQVLGWAVSAEENLFPSQECQGLDSMPEDNAGSTSKAISAGQLPCANNEGFFNQETLSTGAEVSKELRTGQVSGSEVSQSTHVVDSTTNGVHESMSKDSLSVPFQQSQEMHVVLEDSRHYSRVLSDGHLQSGIDDGSLSQEVYSVGVKVFNEMQSDRKESTKGSAVTIDSSGGVETPSNDNFSLPSQESQIKTSQIKTDRSSAFIKEDEGHREMEEERDGTSKQRSLGVVSREVCEGPEIKAVESAATDAKVVAKDGAHSSEGSTEGSVKEQALQLYDGRKYDEDVFMYVPAAIGNVIRSVSQTFKKLFKS